MWRWVMYPSKHVWIFRTKSPSPKTTTNFGIHKNSIPLISAVSQKNISDPQNDPWNSRKPGSHPRPKRTQQTDGKVPRLASAWTKIFKVAASWSRHVFDKTPCRNYGFFRDLNITTFGPFVFTIYSLYTSFFKKGTGLHQDGCTSLKC